LQPVGGTTDTETSKCVSKTAKALAEADDETEQAQA